MLSSFEIKNFRGFQHLRIDKLANVNLIVGRNGVGKTMLLEVLRLFALGGSPIAIYDLLAARDQLDFNSGVADPSHTLLDMRSLFFNTNGPNRNGEKATENTIELGPVKDLEKTLDIRATATDFEISRGASEPRKFKMAEFDAAFGRFVQGVNANRPPTPAYLPALGLNDAAVARLWDLVSLREAEDRVKECLRQIVPAVDRISFVESPWQPGRRIAMVRLSKKAEPVPLKSLGDGLTKMLQIALGFESAARTERQDWLLPDEFHRFRQELQLFLIDEIENGIHYTVQPDLWKFIIRTAHTNNVQVFATSHSWDSILGLREAVDDIPGASVMVIRLEKKPLYTKAVLFEGSELESVAARRH